MSAKHTPGPWAIMSDDLRDDVFISAGAYPFGETIAAEVSQANARLIAAAPDMIETLKYVHEELVQLGYEETSFLDRVSAAISKAEAT